MTTGIRFFSFVDGGQSIVCSHWPRLYPTLSVLCLAAKKNEISVWISLSLSFSISYCVYVCISLPLSLSLSLSLSRFQSACMCVRPCHTKLYYFSFFYNFYSSCSGQFASWCYLPNVINIVHLEMNAHQPGHVYSPIATIYNLTKQCVTHRRRQEKMGWKIQNLKKKSTLL